MAVISFYVVPIVPGATTASASSYIAEAVRTIKERGYRFIVTPASTVFEAPSVREGLEAVAEAVEAVLRAGAARVIAEIKVDVRVDKPLNMEEMPRKVLEKLGEGS